MWWVRAGVSAGVSFFTAFAVTRPLATEVCVCVIGDR
jgi:hypothetical protein